MASGQITTARVGARPLSAAKLPRDERWFRSPTLVRKDHPEIVGEVEPQLAADLHGLAQQVLDTLEDVFAASGCPIVRWDGEPLPETPQHVVVLNPVLLGELPAVAQLALTDEDFDQYRRGLREHLPELYARATHVGRRMNLQPTLHPNLANLIFVDDSARTIRNLSGERKVILMRMLMAKLVASKNVLVPYERDAEGRLVADRLILGTLEGGHPMLDVRETARRLMIFGSTRAVGGWSKSTDLTIPREEWHRSAAVRGLIDLGTYLGQRQLLSDPVAIRDLVRDSRLADTIIGLLNYSRQAEGAFWAVDHDLRYMDRRMAWLSSGVFPLVTVSGRYGAKKSELGPHDIVAALPTEAGTVEVVPVGAEELKGPSVEAEEFTLPLREMTAINIDRVDGLLRIVERGGIEVPPVRAGVHIHRGFLPPTTGRVIVIPTDVQEYPHVGCGVDLMHEMSSYAMRRAIQLWEDSGREAVAAVFYVPNHGTNVFLFWSPDETGGIPADPFALFRELVDSGELVFIPEVAQV